MTSPYQISKPDRAIGIDIGGTRIKAAAVSAEGEVLSSSIESTVDDADELVARVGRIVGGLAGPDAPLAISAPGLVDADNLSIAWMQGRLEAVQGLNWTRRLGRPTWVLNDGHAAAMGEAWVGAAKDKKNVIVLVIGTGVGGGVIANGQLLQGFQGRAGHLGHITLDFTGAADIVNTPGSLEDLVGAHAVGFQSGGRYQTIEQVLAGVREGEGPAVAFWDRYAQGLAAGIASLINVLDPEVVVIGGGVTNCGQDLCAPLHEWIDRFEWRPTGRATPIVVAQLGELAAAVGAARFALLQQDASDHQRESNHHA